jgi:acyl dehydratase
MIDPERLLEWQFPEVIQAYSADDCIRYALALNVGRDPLAEHDLRFTCELEGRPVQALPSMAVILGYPGMWMADAATGITYERIVHGEERIRLHRVLPAQGTVRARHEVTDIVDKGPGRGVLITYDKHLSDAATGELLATVTHTTFARADGGCGSLSRSGTRAAPPQPLPAGLPTVSIDVPTLPQQALLYRLCGDRNPLHGDPAAARQVGFDRPILHGLCTWGMAAHALLAHCADGDPGRLTDFYARFTAPVYPGELLRLDVYEALAGEFRFRMTAAESGKIVLDFGFARFRLDERSD